MSLSYVRVAVHWVGLTGLVSAVGLTSIWGNCLTVRSLRLCVSVEKSIVNLGDEVPVLVSWENAGPEEGSMYEWRGPGGLSVVDLPHARVRCEFGLTNDRAERGIVRVSSTVESSPFALKPGGAVRRAYDLARMFFILEAGNYSVRWTCTVHPPNEKFGAEILETVKGPEQAFQVISKE